MILAFILCPPGLQAIEASKPLIETIGNQGVLINAGNANIWIDSVYNHVTDWDNFSYRSIESKYVEQLNDTSRPQLFLTTHIHRDHFHPYKTGEVLNANKHAFFMATEQATESILESYYNEMRISKRIISLQSGQWQTVDSEHFSDVKVRAHKSTHSHDHYHWIDNAVLEILTKSLHLVHLGDIAPDNRVIELIDEMDGDIDFLIIPYWLLSKQELIRKLDDNGRVKKVLVTHVPAALTEKIGKVLDQYNSGKLSFDF